MTNFIYTPILRWKQGEQKALKNVAVHDRSLMLPIVDVQALESGSSPKLQAQLIDAAGTTHPVGIDLTSAYRGIVPLQALANLTTKLRAAGVQAWPVVHAMHALATMPTLAALAEQDVVIVRAFPEHMTLADLLQVLQALKKVMGKGGRIYVLLDLYSLGDVDANGKAASLASYVNGIKAVVPAQMISIAGGSFPMTLTGLKPGVNNFLPRKELDIWKAVRTIAGCEEVLFGDYAVTNPAPLEEIDPTRMNPSAAIRYTQKNHWWLLRGSGVRTPGKGGMGQYNGLCKLLIANSRYSGATFSFGDDGYYAYAQPGASSGNLTSWRRDATSHHLVFTVRQLATGNV